MYRKLGKNQLFRIQVSNFGRKNEMKRIEKRKEIEKKWKVKIPKLFYYENRNWQKLFMAIWLTNSVYLLLDEWFVVKIRSKSPNFKMSIIKRKWNKENELSAKMKREKLNANINSKPKINHTHNTGTKFVCVENEIHRCKHVRLFLCHIQKSTSF